MGMWLSKLGTKTHWKEDMLSPKLETTISLRSGIKFVTIIENDSSSGDENTDVFH